MIPTVGGRAGLKLLFPVLAVLAAAGCPLGSDYPLSDPAVAPLDEALVGSWHVRNSETGEMRRLTFFPFNEHELVGFAMGDEKGSLYAYRVFVTPVGDERFLNVQELGGDSPQRWLLVRYKAEAKRLTLSVVDDGLFIGRTFSSPEELRGFVRTNLADPRLYTAPGETPRDMVLERAPD